MSKIIYLGIEKMKRYTLENWEEVIGIARVESKARNALLQKELLNSSIETVNQYFEGAIMLCGIFLDESKPPVYLWAYGTNDPRTFAEEFEDIWYFAEVVDVDGNIADF